MASRLPHFLCATRLRVLLDAARSYGAMSPRLAGIAAAAVGLKPVRTWESARHSYRESRFELHPEPVFIVGYWQSGHSLLHNLLACDSQFSTVRLRHAIMPSAFRTAGPVMVGCLDRKLPRDRGVDSLPGGLESLQGDDFLLAGLTSLSSYYAYVFPNVADRVLRRSLLFEGLRSDRITMWQRVYKHALRRVAAEQGKPRVLSRNAANTSRLPQLLQMFPNAKFIHVHRHPEDVFSVQHRRWSSLTGNWSLQEAKSQDFRQRSLNSYETMMRRYLRDRDLVPSACLSEVGHDELVDAPIETTYRLYNELGLGDFTDVRPHIEAYVASGCGSLLKRQPLFNEDVNSVRSRWGFAFEAFGYSTLASSRAA